MATTFRRHPGLGRLTWNAKLSLWEAKVDLLPGYRIRYAMVVEAEWAEADPRVVFEAAADYLAWAKKAEPKCRKRVTDDLLATYNRFWTGCDSVAGRLSRKQFLAYLRPTDIDLYHDGSASWMYDCGPLFAGHAIDLYVGPDRKFVGKAGLFG